MGDEGREGAQDRDRLLSDRRSGDEGGRREGRGRGRHRGRDHAQGRAHQEARRPGDRVRLPREGQRPVAEDDEAPRPRPRQEHEEVHGREESPTRRSSTASPRATSTLPLRDRPPSLSAKVFRTYHATRTVEEALKSKDVRSAADLEKLYFAKEANLAAAMFCNHKRTPPKTWEESLKKKEQKLAEYKAKGKEAMAKKMAEGHRAHQGDEGVQPQHLDEELHRPEDLQGVVRLRRARLGEALLKVPAEEVLLGRAVEEDVAAGQAGVRSPPRPRSRAPEPRPRRGAWPSSGSRRTASSLPRAPP